VVSRGGEGGDSKAGGAAGAGGADDDDKDKKDKDEDDDSDDDIEADESERKDIDRELWVRAVKEHKSTEKGMLEFVNDDIIKVTERGTPLWTGTVVGDKRGLIGKFPPDFVIAPDVKAVRCVLCVLCGG
jgi:hypothetical protein